MVTKTRIPQPCLCLVTDRSVGDERTLVPRVVEAVAGGVDLVQVREKDLPGGRLLELVQSLQEAIGGSALLMINERVDVAIACGAAGVQLGEEALPVAAARRILGLGPLIGRSVHSVEGASRAVAQGADFLIAGMMYASASHPGIPPAGPALVRKIAQDCQVPVLGIGGLKASNLAEVLRAGATGVAVISSILGASRPREAAQELKQAMLAAWPKARAATTPTRRG